MDYFTSIICSKEDNLRAETLYHKLETFVLPSNLYKENPSLRKNLRPIFFASSAHVDNLPIREFTKYLNRSNFLIIICSSRLSHDRRLTGDVVESFISVRKESHIILYIIDESFNNTFPDDWECRKFGATIDAYRYGESEAVKRVAEIMLGLNLGSLSDSLLKRIAKKIGVVKNISPSVASAFDKNNSTSQNVNNSIYKETPSIHKPSEFERQYIVNTSTLAIRFGNILDSEADVIVSSDDNELSMGGGVSGEILDYGGEVILDDARKNIPAQLGDVIITTAGKLTQKYIFHCVTIDYADGQRKASEDKGLQEYIIRRSIDKCLRMMPLLGIDSIAFPTIGAGVAHFSLEEVAMSMADIITDFLYTTNKQYQIEIYLYDRFHQRGVMDFLVFFENVAKSIDNHKRQSITNSEIVESSPVTMTEPQRTKPFGKMAASSPNDEHKVFVSYSRDNIEIAQLFCEQMDNMGISYWIDVNGKYSGNNFKEVLVDAIDSSHVILFLSSQESNRSPFVIKEISLSVADGKTILPIKLDDAPYAKSIRFDLSDIDWIEFSKNKSEEAMEQFRYCLQLYLQ